MAFEAVTLDLQMSVLLLVAILGYLLSVKLGHAVVLGEVLAGIVFGPTFLGIITFNEFLQTMASFGAIVLLFTVGLETKLRDVYNFKSLWVALGGVTLPWIGGYATATLFGYSTLEAVFIGTALTATSIAITVAVLREFGALDTAVAKTIIGAAVVDDVLSLILLSATVGAGTGALTLESFTAPAFYAIAFIAIGLMLGTFFASILRKLDHLVATRSYPENITLIAAFAVAFAYATVAELMGLSAIVGAFIAGVSLEPIASRGFREGARNLEAIFSAIFFVSLGALVKIDPATLVAAAPFVIVLTLVAAATKLAGCYLPASLAGHNQKEALAIGVGMIPRGEVALIVALIGLNAGIIAQSTYAILLFVTMLTTVITPIFLKPMFPRPQKQSRVSGKKRK
jgi:Kef-type K+ transport system membrane component KefB